MTNLAKAPIAAIKQRTTQDPENRLPAERFQFVNVVFSETDTDTDVAHLLVPVDPEKVRYQVVRLSAPAVIYQDLSGSRKPWQRGHIWLRASIPCAAQVLVFLPATTATDAFIAIPPAEGVNGSAFGSVHVPGQSTVLADRPNDVLTLTAGDGISITTTPADDEILIDFPGWASSGTPYDIRPSTDNISSLGNSTQRVLALQLGDSSTGGVRWRASSGVAHLAKAYYSSGGTWGTLYFELVPTTGSPIVPLTLTSGGADLVAGNGAGAAALRIFDASGAYKTTLVAGSTLTADRNLTLTTGDAARTLTLSGNPTLADWFDQAVKSASSPTFAALTTTTTTVKGGGSAVNTRVGGTLYQSITAVGNVGAGEDPLISQAIAANVLAVDGDRLVGEFSGTFAANGNTKRLKLHFGSTVVWDMTAAYAPNNHIWVVRFTIVRTTATTQNVYATFTSSIGATLTTAAGVTTASETLTSGTITLKMTGEATTTNDIVAKDFWCAFLPA